MVGFLRIEGADLQGDDAAVAVDVDGDALAPVAHELLDRIVRLGAREVIDRVAREHVTDRQLPLHGLDHLAALDVVRRDQRVLRDHLLGDGAVVAGFLALDLVDRAEGGPQREARLGDVAVRGDQVEIAGGDERRQREEEQEEDRNPGIAPDMRLVGADAPLVVRLAGETGEALERLRDRRGAVGGGQRGAGGAADLGAHGLRARAPFDPLPVAGRPRRIARWRLCRASTAKPCPNPGRRLSASPWDAWALNCSGGGRR